MIAGHLIIQIARIEAMFARGKCDEFKGLYRYAYRTWHRRWCKNHSFLCNGNRSIGIHRQNGVGHGQKRRRGFFGNPKLFTTAMVFVYFQVLPHHPVGVSEVHLIMGSTLFLLFGAAPAAIGLTLGLLLQGMLFAPFDLPQFGINVTTLLVPLFAMAALAQKKSSQPKQLTKTSATAKRFSFLPFIKVVLSLG